MNVLVVGSGGREHALVWKIAQSPELGTLHAAPGSAAMAALATCHPDCQANDLDGIVELAKDAAIELVVVGPEDPLAAGLADRLRAVGIATFGPSAAAARLEGSKAFAKDFMARHGIPTASYAVFEEAEAAHAYLDDRMLDDRMLDERVSGEQAAAKTGKMNRCVVKADGLAAGKGVAMCADRSAAHAAIDEMMAERRFGDAGRRVVVEEWLSGEEASYYAITDGEHVVTLAAAQDHKRALDGDEGENTGGMGAYSPAPIVSPPVEKKILERIVHPTIRGMGEEGHPLRGVLFVGLMIDPAGDPFVIEFNVRFGDPETQPLLLRMEGDLLRLLDAAARGELTETPPIGWKDAAVCVVLASGGYPRSYATGRRIEGLEALEGDPGLVVFHSGTRRSPSDGGLETAGGRVLGITARGRTVEQARARAYHAVEQVHFEGAHYRRDIAARASRPADPADPADSAERPA